MFSHSCSSKLMLDTSARTTNHHFFTWPSRDSFIIIYYYLDISMDDQSLSPAPSSVANEDLDEPVEGCPIFSSPVPQEHWVDGRAFSSPVPLEHRVEGRAFSSPVPQEHRVEGRAFSSPVPQEHRVEGRAFSSPVPQEHRVDGRAFSSPVPHEGCLLFPLLRSLLEATDSTGRCDSDLCWMCQQNSTLIMRAHNRPVEKSEVNIIHVHYFILKKDNYDICFSYYSHCIELSNTCC